MTKSVLKDKLINEFYLFKSNKNLGKLGKNNISNFKKKLLLFFTNGGLFIELMMEIDGESCIFSKSEKLVSFKSISSSSFFKSSKSSSK